MEQNDALLSEKVINLHGLLDFVEFYLDIVFYLFLPKDLSNSFRARPVSAVPESWYSKRTWLLARTNANFGNYSCILRILLQYTWYEISNDTLLVRYNNTQKFSLQYF